MSFPAGVKMARQCFLRLGAVLTFVLVVSAAGLGLNPAGQWGGSLEPSAWRYSHGSWTAAADRKLPGSFTVESIVTITEEFATRGKEVVLVGAASDDSTWPDIVRVTWGPSSSGWSTLWSLRLESDVALLTQPATGKAARALELHRGYPVTGHQYQTLLSYNSLVGTIQLVVWDLSDGTLVYSGKVGAVLPSPDFGFVATVAERSNAENPLIRVDRLGTQPMALPVATEWKIGSRSADGRITVSTQFESASDVVIVVDSDVFPADGEYRVRARNGRGTYLLRSIAPGTGETVICLAPDELPIGSSTLIFEYAVDDEVLLADSVTITIGRLRFAFRDLYVDRNESLIRGVMTISSSQPTDVPDLVVEAVIYEKMWEQERRQYRNDLQSRFEILHNRLSLADGEELMYRFSIPLPERAGFYELQLVPATTLGVNIETVGASMLFHTYEPARYTNGEPFVIAVLPDTQNYAAENPTAFLRQTQWIAEVAKARNILLALHLGDITNDNYPLQWQRAKEALSLLDDVVPYVLAQGNHDMTAAGGGNVADRHHSRINDYFPVASLPWIKGTFEPGKLENSYSSFAFGDDNYLVVALEFGPRDEVLEWANEVVSQHPHHTVIVITHAYTTRSGRRSHSVKEYAIAQNPNTTVNDGDEIWDKFVSRHPNILMVLSGHHNSENGISRQVARGLHGNPVYEMMINYQFDTGGGSGYLALFEFRPDGTIEVIAYSPYLDAYRTEVSIFGFNNHFIIDTAAARYVDVEYAFVTP